MTMNDSTMDAKELLDRYAKGERIFTGINLIGAELNEASLSFANLRGADLVGVDLSGADLSGADLDIDRRTS